MKERAAALDAGEDAGATDDLVHGPPAELFDEYDANAAEAATD